jgi:integrating conjugative element protein (TIGR03761 family)
MDSDEQQRSIESARDPAEGNYPGPGPRQVETLPGEGTAPAAEHSSARQPKAALLVDIEPDVMTLHTREAYWMFSGRAWTNERPRIIGGQRAAAALNSLRHISVGGNPYADWFLVCFEARLNAIRVNLDRVINEYQEAIDELKIKGLELRVLGSRSPLHLTVAFGSAYGYAVAEAIVEFDYFVRILKTLVLKNRITADQGRASIRGVARPLRRLFVRVIEWEHGLRVPEWRVISRRDYLETADEKAKQRALGAFARFGPIPQLILSGATVPRHVVRRATTDQVDFVNLRSPTASTSDAPPSQVLL